MGKIKNWIKVGMLGVLVALLFYFYQFILLIYTNVEIKNLGGEVYWSNLFSLPSLFNFSANVFVFFIVGTIIGLLFDFIRKN